MSQSESPESSYRETSDEEASIQEQGDGSLSDMLNEMRVLLPGAQTLTAFMIIVPFNSQFQNINATERWVYVITFLCSLVSLILFAAPAAHHRLERPLLDREGFKNWATKFILAGIVFLSIALVLATQLVMSQVHADPWIPWFVSGAVAFFVLTIWWLLPRNRVQRLKAQLSKGTPVPSKTDTKS